MSKLRARVQKKSIFVPICRICGVVSHIKPNSYFLRQKPKSVIRSTIKNTDIPKFVYVCHFCDVSSHIHHNYHKLKFKHFVFQFRI